MKFRCVRDIKAASGTQEFQVEAATIDEAEQMFKRGEGELVASECEVTDLYEYDLDSIWQEDQ